MGGGGGSAFLFLFWSAPGPPSGACRSAHCDLGHESAGKFLVACILHGLRSELCPLPIFACSIPCPLPLTWSCICHKGPHYDYGRPLPELHVLHRRRHIHMVFRYGCPVMRAFAHGCYTGAAHRHPTEDAQRPLRRGA